MKSEFGESIKQKIIDFLYPANVRCPVCERLLFAKDEYVCHLCVNKFRFEAADKCAICGAALAEGLEVCAECRENKFAFAHAFSLVEYNEISGSIVAEFKYYNNKAIAESCGEHMYQEFIKRNPNFDFDIITCVPSKKESFEKRGYNQAAVIASAFANMAKLPVYCDLLVVVGEPLDQIGLNYDQRKENVKDCFAVTEPGICSGKNVLIIDDVVTTGSTLSECAKMIMKSNALSVSFATYATAVR